MLGLVLEYLGDSVLSPAFRYNEIGMRMFLVCKTSQAALFDHFFGLVYFPDIFKGKNE